MPYRMFLWLQHDYHLECPEWVGQLGFHVTKRKEPTLPRMKSLVLLGLASLLGLQVYPSTKACLTFREISLLIFPPFVNPSMTLCYSIWAVGSVSVDKWRYLTQANMASVTSVVVDWGSHLITVSDNFRAWNLACNLYQFQQCRSWMQTTWMYM